MKTPLELLKAYLDNVQDLDLIASLFAADGALELPYLATIGFPPRAAGPQEITDFLKNVIGLVVDFKFHSLEVFMETQDQVFAEYKVTTTVKETGAAFNQHYMGRLVAENGKIKLLRESLDSAATVKTFGITGF
jgi:ketosteroid isomerase-like protein